MHVQRSKSYAYSFVFVWYMSANGSKRLSLIRAKPATLAVELFTSFGCNGVIQVCVCLNRPFKINIMICVHSFCFVSLCFASLRYYVFFCCSNRFQDVPALLNVLSIKYINYGLKWRKWFVWFAVRDRIGRADLLYMAAILSQLHLIPTVMWTEFLFLLHIHQLFSSYSTCFERRIPKDI